MNDLMKNMDHWFALTLADEVADKLGDLSRFVKNYRQFRESMSVKASIEAALRDQELWDQFLELAAVRTGQSSGHAVVAELSRLHAENQRLQNRLKNKRAIFQAGRDSYKSACVPFNTDDEAWEKYITGEDF